MTTNKRRAEATRGLKDGGLRAITTPPARRQVYEQRNGNVVGQVCLAVIGNKHDNLIHASGRDKRGRRQVVQVHAGGKSTVTYRSAASAGPVVPANPAREEGRKR